MRGEPMHSGIQDGWIENVCCAAARRTVTGDADPVTIFDHVEDFIRESGAARAKSGSWVNVPPCSSVRCSKNCNPLFRH